MPDCYGDLKLIVAAFSFHFLSGDHLLDFVHLSPEKPADHP